MAESTFRLKIYHANFSGDEIALLRNSTRNGGVKYNILEMKNGCKLYYKESREHCPKWYRELLGIENNVVFSASVSAFFF